MSVSLIEGKMDLLWENPNPTASMAATTINIPTLGNYKMIEIIFDIFPASDIYKGIDAAFGIVGRVGVINSLVQCADYKEQRKYSTSSTSISFAQNYENSSTVENRCNIPLYIYGIK